jgi:hypothetical protein
MSQEHERRRRQVLMLEDLDGVERERADEHLESCASCRRLRERLLAAEATGREFARPPSGDDPLGGLSELERAQARASLAALQRTARRGSPVNLGRLTPLALAAILLAAVLLPLQRERSPVSDLQVGSPLVLRGEASQAAATEHGVSFRLRQAGYPVLLHVDALGTVRLLYPEPGSQPEKHAADQLLLLPPPGRGADWRADLPSGRETYLLGVVPGDSPPSGADLGRLPGLIAGPDREQVAAQALRQLQAICGRAVRLEAPGGR